MNRITGTVLILLSIIGLTYFAYYTEAYLSYFKNLKEPEVIIVPKSEQLKEVSFYGVEFKNTSISSNSLLTDFNIFLKETKDIKLATFVYITKSDLTKENVKLMIENQNKLLTCFDRNNSGCLFYKKDKETSVYDELSLAFVLNNSKSTTLGMSTFKYNMKKQNYLNLITELGVEVSKESVLGETTFYTENSIFKEKEKSKKEDRFIFGIFLHFIIVSLFITSVCFLTELFTKKGRNSEDEDAAVMFFLIVGVVLFFIMIGANTFDFLIPLYN